MGKVPVKRPPNSRRKKRSMKNARTTLDANRREAAKTCRHSVFRFRNRTSEQVCSVCGAVRKVSRDDDFGLRVIEDWVQVDLLADVVDDGGDVDTSSD